MEDQLKEETDLRKALELEKTHLEGQLQVRKTEQDAASLELQAGRELQAALADAHRQLEASLNEKKREFKTAEERLKDPGVRSGARFSRTMAGPTDPPAGPAAGVVDEVGAPQRKSRRPSGVCSRAVAALRHGPRCGGGRWGRITRPSASATRRGSMPARRRIAR